MFAGSSQLGPIRTYHWTTVFSLLLLVATGLVMMRPPDIARAQETSPGDWLRWVKVIHLTGAFVFTAVFVIRVRGMVAGRKAARREILGTPLASASYLIAFVATITAIVTGLGRETAALQWHYIATCVFVVFAIVHVYLTVVGPTVPNALSRQD